MRSLAVLSAVLALSACADLGQLLIESGATYDPGRTYTTPQITLPPTQRTQPAPTAGREEYRTVLVNTPSGMVYKRCKVLNDQVVACF
jgi:hypothetical protein